MASSSQINYKKMPDQKKKMSPRRFGIVTPVQLLEPGHLEEMYQ